MGNLLLAFLFALALAMVQLFEAGGVSVSQLRRSVRRQLMQLYTKIRVKVADNWITKLALRLALKLTWLKRRVRDMLLAPIALLLALRDKAFHPGTFRSFQDSYFRSMIRLMGLPAVAGAAPFPTTQEELKEILHDDKRRAEIFADAELTQEFVAAYAKGMMADGDLGKQLSEVMKAEWAKFLEDNKVNRIPLTEAAIKGKPAAAGATEGFKSLGEFLVQMGCAVNPNLRIRLGSGDDARLKTLGEEEGGQGGFLVPQGFIPELMKPVLEDAIVRPRARVIPMPLPTVTLPAIHETTRASNVFGGVSGTWVSEAGTVSSTTNEPEFKQIRLSVNKLTGYTRASNELLADSAIALEALLMQLFPEAIAYFEDDAFISGTGVGQPLGLLNADALIAVAAETGQASTTILWENIVNMYSRMLPSSLGKAIWLANLDTFPQLAVMSLAVGTGGSAIWLNNGVAGPPMTILGRPVIFSEKPQTLGTAGDLYFVDFSKYLIGDRQTLTMSASPHVNFTTDEMVWRFVERVDGRPWITSELTPRVSSVTLSPYVSLASR